MERLPEAVIELFGDPDGKKAEECLLAVIADLERAGIRQRAIGKALSRVLLGFCAENGKLPDRYGWAHDLLYSMGRDLEQRARKRRRRWVKRFMTKTGRLYFESSFEVHRDLPPPVKQALDARLTALDPVGRA